MSTAATKPRLGSEERHSANGGWRRRRTLMVSTVVMAGVSLTSLGMVSAAAEGPVS